VCIATVVAVFAGSVLDLEMDVWNTLLIAGGSAILVAMLKVFHSLVNIDKLLVVEAIKLLRHQMWVNERDIMSLGTDGAEWSGGEGKAAELRRANQALELFVREIKNSHRSLIIFGVLPLTKQNLAKLGAAIGAALFTTVLRQAIRFN
jgi:hypothetical protein